MALIVNTNSYISVADADLYFDDNINYDTWATYTDAQKARALISATSMLDRLYDWLGCKTLSTQSLQWPRQYIYCDCNCNRDVYNSRSCNSCSELDSSIVPDNIKYATCELALYILIDNPMAVTNNDDKIKKTKLDVMEVEYFDKQNLTKQKLINDATAMYILECYGTLKGKSLYTQRG